MRKFLSLAFPLLESRLTLTVCECVLAAPIFTQKMGCSNSTLQVTHAEKPKPTEDEYVEDVVCKDGDVRENEMKVFDLKDAGKVLLVRQNGKLNALGTKCSHYGAPLDKGALGEGRIRCQWHGACFNITTGDIEDFPGLDSLPCYEVTLTEKNEVMVRARKAELQSNKRVKTMTKMDCRDEQHIVVVGGGPSGATCVETLRQEGFLGRITLVSKENALPYDRIKVSKAMDVDVSKLELRTVDFYRENAIEVLKNVEAVSLDTTKNEVVLSNGNTLKYDRLYVATGSKPLKAPVPGAELTNVLTLRTFKDSAYLNAQLSENKEVVVLGGSFIALEAAAYCVSKVKKVTVVVRGDTVLKESFGPKIGAAIQKLFVEKGITFQTNNGIKRCVDDGNGRVGSVELVDGSILQADLCVMGVGSAFYTEFLKNSGVKLQANGAVDVNEYLQTNVANVFAGGDIAFAPVWSHNNTKTTIGHYPLAHKHGHIAGLNMLNKNVPLKAVPYFWTMLFGKSYRYAGHGKHDEIIYNGNVDEHKFVAYYLQGEEIVAISSCCMDPVVSQFAELLAQGKKLYRKDVEGNSLDWTNTIH